MATSQNIYRKFRLINAKKEYYELTNPEIKHFYNKPEGLGFKGTLHGYRFKNIYNVKSRTFDLPSLSGSIVFYEDKIQDSYQMYYDFMTFLQQTPLEIEYLTPQNSKWSQAKYAVCEVTQLRKSETDRIGMLSVPITIQCLTFWRDRTIKTYTAVPGIIGEQLQLPMEFPFWFGLDSMRGIVIYNDGTVEAPLTVDIIGASVNPTYKIFDEDGNEYGACRFEGTFSRVTVNSELETIELMKSGTVLGNPAKYEDLTIGNPDDDDYYLTFLNIRPGKNLMTVSAGPSFAGSVKFSWRDEYKSF